MATLKKGMSFRRQGSSGLVWADEAIFADEGTLLVYHPMQGGKLRPNPARGLGNPSRGGSENPSSTVNNPSPGLDNPSLSQKKNPTHGQSNPSRSQKNPSHGHSTPGRGFGLRSKSESASSSRKPRSGVMYWLKKAFNVHS